MRTVCLAGCGEGRRGGGTALCSSCCLAFQQPRWVPPPAHIPPAPRILETVQAQLTAAPPRPSSAVLWLQLLESLTLSPGLPSPPEPEGPYLQRPSGSNCHLPRKTGATFQGVLASQKQSPRLLTPGSFTCPGPQAKRWLCGPAPLEPLSQGPTMHTDDPHGRANPGLDDPRAYQRTSARLQPDFPSPSPPCVPTPMTQLPNLPASGRSVSLGLCLVLIPQAPLIGTGGKKEQSLAQVIRQVPFTYPPSYPCIQHLSSIPHQ